MAIVKWSLNYSYKLNTSLLVTSLVYICLSSKQRNLFEYKYMPSP